MNPDFLVVGAGVAGLRAAIELASAGTVLVLAKDTLSESSSVYAQGGIAAALSDDDDIELHEQDTLAAGDGLCNPEAVRALVEEGPTAIEELIEFGAGFDRDGARLAFAREGAHSRNRVLHANGDSTGKEISRALYAKAASIPNIQFHSFMFVTDFLVADGVVAGALAVDEQSGEFERIAARATLLATGGLGRAFLETTNPDVATGDGVATAWRAGAEISDLEFVQFHPTALHVAGAPRFLLSEALRGEGALLRNAAGERFMVGYHPLAELAPRDVVSRSIAAELVRTGEPHVYLDLRHLGTARVRDRFPRIYQTCLNYGVDIGRDLAPVHPAAHYAMGGVRTNLDGATNLGRLYAAGECACTGVHGANRLASNSLLEGVVFGARAARAMLAHASDARLVAPDPAPALFPDTPEQELRSLMWSHCGIVREGDSLRRAVETLEAAPSSPKPQARRADYERRNIHAVGRIIAHCALARQESRGAHYRTDVPEKRAGFQRHSVTCEGAGVDFR
ncbi:MAG: L-aspartate oxidase [Acidobacteria bacterium]|nr:L-aspartate oxidase [Acidobacteriota bacterium]